MSVWFSMTLGLCLCQVYYQKVTADGRAPTVDLKQGRVSGVAQKSDSGRNYNAFYGIPYGRVPGRFMPPEPAGSFPPNFVADNKMQFCIQNMVPMNLGVIGTEDCLTLHVYTSRLPTVGDENKLPVMVFIYSGIFKFGSATPLIYGPSHLMEHDIVLVVMNYRVGVFGFLATGDGSSPGNYGLLDQNLALMWVRDNVKAFGGDNNQVTIFGESAGAASVYYHMLSPLSIGLFHRVIAMSGTPLCPWALNTSPLQTARFVADAMKCPPTESTEELVHCLRHVTAQDLATLLVTVTPVVEPVSSGRFLIEHPYRLLTEGRVNKVPVISGITLDEFATPLLYKKDPIRFNVSKDEFLDSGFVQMFRYALGEDFAAKIDANKIRLMGQEYFGEIDFHNDTALDIADIQFNSDADYGSCNDFTIKLLTAQDVPVYSYVFEYVSDYTNPTHVTGKPDVSHKSDLAYMFDMKLCFPGSHYSDEAKKFMKKYVALWTNFATYSNPTPTKSLHWKPTPPGANNQFLRLAKHMKMGENIFTKRMTMWNEFLRLYFRSWIINKND